MIPIASDVDFKNFWDSLLSALESAAGSEALFTLAGIAGTVVLLAAFLVYLLAKRRGGNQHSFGLLVAFVLGGACATPKVIIPGLLWFCDLIGNAAIQLMRNAGVSI